MSFTLSYGLVLCLVVAELVFAFAVGITCIIFSYNLLQAINTPHDDSNKINNTRDRTGDMVFPPSRKPSFQTLTGSSYQSLELDGLHAKSDGGEEFDVEQASPVANIARIIARREASSTLLAKPTLLELFRSYL